MEKLNEVPGLNTCNHNDFFFRSLHCLPSFLLVSSVKCKQSKNGRQRVHSWYDIATCFRCAKYACSFIILIFFFRILISSFFLFSFFLCFVIFNFILYSHLLVVGTSMFGSYGNFSEVWIVRFPVFYTANIECLVLKRHATYQCEIYLKGISTERLLLRIPLAELPFNSELAIRANERRRTQIEVWRRKQEWFEWALMQNLKKPRVKRFISKKYEIV